MSSQLTEPLSKVVLLTGAGASITLGVPEMRQFYRQFLRPSESAISSEEKALCKFLGEKLRVSEDLEELLLAIERLTSSRDGPSLHLAEFCVSQQRVSSRRKAFRLKYVERVKQLLMLRERMLEFLAKKCFQFDRQAAFALLQGVVQAASEKCYPVFTTNYDFAFEHVAEELGVQRFDNFVSRHGRQFWNENVEFNWNAKGLHLVKLHGSVTWYQDDSGQIEKIKHLTTLNPAGKEITRLIVFPTRFKDIYSPYYFSLYWYFLSALDSADVLVLIGHSLRDEYLRAGIIERFRRGSFALVVVDPNVPTALLKEMQPHGPVPADRVTHVPLKFEEFAHDLSRILMGAEPSDIPALSARTARHIKRHVRQLKIHGRIGALKVGQKCAFEVILKAYVPPKLQPGRLRVWLSANYDDPHKGPVSQVSGVFLEHAQSDVELRGLAEGAYKVNVTIPRYADWVAFVDKATLHVAVVSEGAKKPAQVRQQHVVVESSRILSYKQ